MIKRLFKWYCNRAMQTDAKTLSCQKQKKKKNMS